MSRPAAVNTPVEYVRTLIYCTKVYKFVRAAHGKIYVYAVCAYIKQTSANGLAFSITITSNKPFANAALNYPRHVRNIMTF